MIEAARAAFPDFRRYLRAKARALGLAALAWYDLFAPVGAGERVWSWAEAVSLLSSSSSAATPSGCAGWPSAPSRERWIDAEPRPGKRDGAFCMRLRHGESRILTNYSPSFNGVSTLAHELGHAYHNLNLAALHAAPARHADDAGRDRQHLLRDDRQGGRPGRGRAGASSASSWKRRCKGACQVVVDIISRFVFERRVFAGAAERELSVDELNELMLDAQRGTYGDGLDPDALHPYMWAVKGHYYSTATLVLQLPVHVRPAVRPRALRPLPASTGGLPEPATTSCWPRPAWPTPPSWPRASASTCARRRSGAPASTSSAPTSTGSRRWSVRTSARNRHRTPSAELGRGRAVLEVRT